MHIIESMTLKKTIKSLVNLLIPISCFLTFAIIWLFEKVIIIKFSTTYPELALNPIAANLVYSGALRAIALAGFAISTIVFIAWLSVLVKNRSEKYLLEINKAVITVLIIWAFGTLLAPLLLYLTYKPIFDPIIK